jgi:hypothetical protein
LKDLRAEKQLRRRLLAAVSCAEKAKDTHLSRKQASPIEVLNSFLNKALKNARKYILHCSEESDNFNYLLHVHRRRIAGLHQELSLWSQGKDAYKAVEKAKLLILNGHWYAIIPCI